jgi:short-subunit dehydrogenase
VFGLSGKSKLQKRPVVIITGASVGLGLAIAKFLIKKDSFHLVLTSRKSSLERFADEGIAEGDHLWLRPLEVTSARQREALMREVLEAFDQVDYLINNAGVAYRTACEHIEPGELMRQMDINFYSPLSLARLALPSMRKYKGGHIINVSSVSGMMAMPTMGLYSASKFALEGLTESLWHEVKPWNIKVTLVQPGFIKSDAFSKVPWTRKAKIATKKDHCPYHNHYASMAPFIQKIMRRVPASPETVAEKIYKIMNMKNPPLRKAVTADATVFSLLRRLLPSKLYLWVLHHSLPNLKNWGADLEIEESVYSNFLIKTRRAQPVFTKNESTPLNIKA